MGQKRILVVEDDMDVAELLLMFFEGQGYTVFHADLGADGVSLARSKFPNLILLDIMLPDMNGFDVCAELRANNLTKYVPTIFLTQKNTRNDRVSGLQLGADDYITKPFDIEELRVRVSKSIERATRDHIHEEVTGLPTGPVIDEEQTNFAQSEQPWSRLDISVEEIDGFRDVYGFLSGNDAINLASRILTNTLIEYGTDNDFIAIVDDKSFVIFTFSNKVSDMVKMAQEEFSGRSAALYKFTDVEQGYVVMDEGTDHERQMPLMSLNIQVQDFVAS